MKACRNCTDTVKIRKIKTTKNRKYTTQVLPIFTTSYSDRQIRAQEHANKEKRKKSQSMPENTQTKRSPCRTLPKVNVCLPERSAELEIQTRSKQLEAPPHVCNCLQSHPLCATASTTMYAQGLPLQSHPSCGSTKDGPTCPCMVALTVVGA